MRTTPIITGICLLCIGASIVAPQAAEKGRDQAPGRSVHFVEGAGEAGLRFEQHSGGPGKRFMIEVVGSGVVLADLDGDGHLDVYLVNGAAVSRVPSRERVNRLFLGDGGGRFRPGPAGDPAEDPGFGFGAVAADYDRDGDLDLYVCNWGPNVLLRNRGDGTFEDVTAAAGVGDPRWSASAAFGDVDGDGWLDLYVANYFEFAPQNPINLHRARWAGLDVFPGPRGMTAEPDRLYRNRGDGTFEDATAAAGLLAVEPGYSLAVTMSDLDADGWLDIYVAADSTRNLYWHNQGGGRFVEKGLESGTALSGNAAPQASMGIAVGDFKEDGLADLVLTHFARDYNTYYEAVGELTFLDATFSSGLAPPTFPMLAWGIEAQDWNADGHLDLFFANGHVYPNVDERPMSTTYAQRNQLFLGRGDGTFEDVTGRAGPGLERASVSRGAAAGDLDEDGRIDLVVSDLDGPTQLLWNRTPDSGHWLGVRVTGRAGLLDRAAVGTLVTVRAGSHSQTREVRAGASYASATAAPLFFGLGDRQRVEEIIVRHPGGVRRTLRDVAADRVIAVEISP